MKDYTFFKEITMDLVNKYLGEGKKEDAYGALTALIGFMKKQKNPDKTGKSILKQAEGIKKYADKNDKSMSPDQAEWVAETWNSIKGGMAGAFG